MTVEAPDGEAQGTSRRLFLQLAAATGTIAAISTSIIAQQTEITLEGQRDRWVGRSPAEIAGDQNPTLQLASSERYTLTWENVDGKPHNIVIAAADGTVIERTPLVDGEGDTQSLEFEATPEMSTYYCEVHPDSMRGAIGVDGDGSGGSIGTAVSEAFSTGRFTGGQDPTLVETSASGAALFGLGDDRDELHYVLVGANVDRATQAFVRLGGADEDGDVVARLFGDASDRGSDGERAISGSGILAEGTITGENLVGPFEDESLETLLEGFREETVGVTVQTGEHPDGEIRGQISPVDAVTVELTERVDATVAADESFRVETRATIDVTDPNTERDSRGDSAADRRERVETEGDIELSYEGSVAPGNTVTITAISTGAPVVGAAVEVKNGDGDRRHVGRTDDNGQTPVTVPASGDKAGKLDVKVRDNERESELEVENDF